MGDVTELRKHQPKPEDMIDACMSLPIADCGLIAGFSYFLRADGDGYASFSDDYHDLPVDQKKRMAKAIGKVHRQMVDNIRRLER